MYARNRHDLQPNEIEIQREREREGEKEREREKQNARDRIVEEDIIAILNCILANNASAR